jgi:hypothetical protein
MPRSRTLLFALVGALIYIAWAVPFMLESSVVAIDGRNDPLRPVGTSPKCTFRGLLAATPYVHLGEARREYA